jgi:hypothetical protein
MRGFASYILAGILVVVAMDFTAAPVGLGLPVAAWPAIGQGPVAQTVIRTHKADRLSVPISIGKLPAAPKAPTMLVGCDPVFSPLSASARVNFPGRCMA